MSDRDAWIHFYCAFANREGYSMENAQRPADYALELLRERDKKKMFDRPDAGYREQPDYPEYK